jgi:hypothetical protein
VRFAPPLAGTWRYATTSTDPALNNLTGVIEATAPTPEQLQANANHREQIKVGANGHHFAYADGTPVLILADCQLFTRWPLSEFKSMIATRKAQGFNGLNVRLAKAKEKNEDGLPYFDSQVDWLNPAFFQGADARMKTLWESGFVTFFMPDFLGQGVYTMQDARDVSRYMLARYAAFNVAYIITGEYDDFRRNVDFWDRYEPWNELGNYIKTINDRAYKAPLGVHPLNASSGKISHDQPWLDYNQIQSKLWKEFDTVPLAVLTDFRRTPAKPTFYAEGIYENQPWAGDLGADWHVRHQTWVPLTNGAAVVDYGEHYVKGGGIPAAELPKHLDQPGARQALYALQFMQKLEWWKHTPQREWVLVNGQVPPLNELKKNTALPYLLAEPGKSYVLYLMRGLQDATLTLTHLDKKLYRARWFDPRTGRTNEIITNGQQAAARLRHLQQPRLAPRSVLSGGRGQGVPALAVSGDRFDASDCADAQQRGFARAGSARRGDSQRLPRPFASRESRSEARAAQDSRRVAHETVRRTARRVESCARRKRHAARPDDGLVRLELRRREHACDDEYAAHPRTLRRPRARADEGGLEFLRRDDCRLYRRAGFARLSFRGRSAGATRRLRAGYAVGAVSLELGTRRCAARPRRAPSVARSVARRDRTHAGRPEVAPLCGCLPRLLD